MSCSRRVARELEELLGLAARGRERLLAEHVAAVLEREAHVGRMHVRGRGDHDDVDVRLRHRLGRLDELEGGPHRP